MGKMKKSEMAAYLNMNEKTYREYHKLAYANNKIESLLDPGIREKYADVIGKSHLDKKNGISMKQIIDLSKMDPDTITETINAIITDPGNAKQIMINALAEKADVKVTVTLPASINQWYADKAAENNKSKSDYIAGVLKLFHTLETDPEADEDEDENGNITGNNGGKTL